MNPIDFEDRTNESPEQVDQRQAFGRGLMIAQVAYEISSSDSKLALKALSAALGMGIVRSDVSVDEIVDLVRHYAATARTQMTAARKEPSGGTGN